MKMKTKPSGPALFMYCVIALSAVCAAVCFCLYYGKIHTGDAVLWTGVTCFTVMYHLWLRIIMGNVTKLFSIRYTQLWFQAHAFEERLYRIFRVIKWKVTALTYNPEVFVVQAHALDEIANTMSKAETDHWMNELISLSTLLFGLLWGQLWIFALTAVLAMLFDGQFIVIQRYNRPRVVKILKRQHKHKTEVSI